MRNNCPSYFCRNHNLLLSLEVEKIEVVNSSKGSKVRDLGYMRCGRTGRERRKDLYTIAAWWLAAGKFVFYMY